MKTQSATLREEEQKRKIQPVFLYRFDYGTSQNFFTNYDVNLIVVGGPGAKMSDPQTFTAVQIKHDRNEQTAELNPKQLNVTLAANESTLRTYFLLAPVNEINIEIWRANPATLADGDDLEYDDLFLEFRGTCSGVGFKDYLISANFISPLLQEDRQIPRYFYQKTCNHQLYSEFCTVIAANFGTGVTVAAINRVDKTIDLALTSINVDSPPRAVTITDETFIGGYFSDAGGQKYGIMACEAGVSVGMGTGVRLWLEWWPPNIAVSDAITVFPGCMKIPRICSTVFDNLENYGGTPYVPVVNPTANSIITGDPGS